MRTTLTLENDVSALLTKIQTEKHISLKTLVNQALRQGLLALESKKSKPKKTFQTKSVSLGECLVGSLDNTREILSLLEGEQYK